MVAVEAIAKAGVSSRSVGSRKVDQPARPTPSRARSPPLSGLSGSGTHSLARARTRHGAAVRPRARVALVLWACVCAWQEYVYLCTYWQDLCVCHHVGISKCLLCIRSYYCFFFYFAIIIIIFWYFLVFIVWYEGKKRLCQNRCFPLAK